MEEEIVCKDGDKKENLSLYGNELVKYMNSLEIYLNPVAGKNLFHVNRPNLQTYSRSTEPIGQLYVCWRLVLLIGSLVYESS